MRRKASCILAGLLALVLALGPVSVSAESAAEAKDRLDALESEKTELDAQIAELEGQLSDNMGEMEAIVAQKNVIDQEIFLLYQQQTNINEQICAYSLLIADKQEELDAAQTRLSELQAQNKERIRAMEKNGKLSYWSVLFKANSFMDLLDRLKMIQELAEADQQRLAEMNQAAREVAEAKTSLENEKTSLESTKEELTATQTELENKRLEADGLLSELLAKGEEYENLLAQSEQEQSDLAAQIAKAESTYQNAKNKEAQQNAAQQPSSGNSSGTGNTGSANAGTGSTGGASTGNTVSGVTWLVPISYTYFSSPFGYRWHPLSGLWKMHYGVDLAAPTGTPIYATRSGTVTTTAYEEGGAGYYVSINHGDGYASIYMHMTHYIVSPGQQVQAGQVIGYCGSTGGSSGPHLHFGISYYGTYVNPADYINI